MDESVATALDISRDHVSGWLAVYTRLFGLAILIGIIVSIALREYLTTLILACTLHLQIVSRYNFRTAAGIDLWTNQPKEPPSNSEIGSSKPPL